MVYQESSLVPSMTVAQNLELGMEKLFTVYSKINIAATQSQQSLNFNVDPLGAGRKPRHREAPDGRRSSARCATTPRSSFSTSRPRRSRPEEMQHLFHLLYTLRDRGAGIIFISHALEEALKIANRITVLRDGKSGAAPRRPRSMTAIALVRHDDRTRHLGEPLRVPTRRSEEPTRWQARRKGALGRKRHHGRGREEHVVFRVRRRGGRHLRGWSGPVAPKSRMSSAARASVTSFAAA